MGNDADETRSQAPALVGDDGTGPVAPVVVGASAGAIAQIDCELEEAVPGGDHTIAIGRVVGATFDATRLPLVYFRRAYRALNMDGQWQ